MILAYEVPFDLCSYDLDFSRIINTNVSGRLGYFLSWYFSHLQPFTRHLPFPSKWIELS